MKISLPQIRSTQAMTMPEMLVSMGIFVMLVAGLISINVFGLRYDQLTNSKLGATDQSRMNFNLLINEIRSAKNVQIGSGWNTGFVSVGSNQLQRGDTIQITPSTNLNWAIYYYFRTNCPSNSSWLVRASTSNGGTNFTTNIMATCITNMNSQWLTNACVFQAYDYTGTNLLTVNPTNYSVSKNYVIGTLLQFYQYQYPITYVGSNALFNYYQLQFMATRRAVDN